jgi:hypothetical protein
MACGRQLSPAAEFGWWVAAFDPQRLLESPILTCDDYPDRVAARVGLPFAGLFVLINLTRTGD